MHHLLIAITFLGTQLEVQAQGKLFIIGGGKRPPELLQRIIKESGIAQKGYIMILPFASSEQDSSIYYARKQFVQMGIQQVYGIQLDSIRVPSAAQLDSIANAALIYIPGGDQQVFMKRIRNNGIYEAMHKAFKNGKTLAGTSAGAAIMSFKMITGVELRYPNTTESSEKDGFKSIEAANIEIDTGMGFLQKCIVDQHFIKRKRQNRLIAVAIEHPGYLCIGIDEATAIFVTKNTAEVVGDSQVLVLRSTDKKAKTINGKLGAQGLQMDLYIHGDTFKIP